MTLKSIIIFSFVFFLQKTSLFGQIEKSFGYYDTSIIVGAEKTTEYLPLLKGNRVAIVSNQTSVIKNVHLVDSLLSLGVDIKKVFSPEHGFRGVASAGELVKSGIDIKTGLPITSLYGKNKKPTSKQLSNVDVVIFDIQDVGVRFYTYISTMHYVMEACAENNKQLIILDRPNPNGFYVDGPVLKEEFNSFIGMHPIPVVHGLTVGELANMINGEGWLKDSVKCNVIIIETDNYEHSDFYKLPIAPSPNLPNMSAIYLYPSLCFFEGTDISIGRGTDLPFQVLGSPSLKETHYVFTPTSKVGAWSPKHENDTCNGYNLSLFGDFYMRDTKQIYLYWMISSLSQYKTNSDFFTRPFFFDLLAGTNKLRNQLEQKIPLSDIKKTWEDDLKKYNVLKKKYLIYKDF
jgi:uncharacterized protein YbbC (DUF1343 family)